MSPTQGAVTLEVCTNVDRALKRVNKKRTLSTFWCALLSIPGMMLLFGHHWAPFGRVVDFTGFLVGAKLLRTSRIYDVATNLALQKAITGHMHPGIIFMRMPFWAFAMKPFLLLTYSHALFLWRTVLWAALLGCVFISGRGCRPVLLAISWSIPAACCLLMANDSPLLLLLMFISVFCWRKDRHLLAGAVLGLCLAKFHFLIFLPLLLFRKELRRELTGFCLSVATLLAINFAVQPDWIPLYWRALHLEKNINAISSLMPNFYATFFWTGHPGLAVAIGAALVLALTWPICRRLPFDIAMPICIFSGLLAAPHTNPLDGVLAIPALLAINDRFPQAKPLALFLLSPVAGLLSCFGPQTIGPAIVVAVSLALLGTTLYSTALDRSGDLVDKMQPTS